VFDNYKRIISAMIPKKYAWLADEPGPKLLIEALKTYGTKEMPGTGDNPEILSWAKETDLNRVYSADSVPWCGLWMAVVAKRADKDIPKDPLWARNWAGFGTEANQPGLGDVLVFQRQQGGHVGLYIGEDDTAYHVLGGNQSDQVSITRILKSRCIAKRRPLWKTAQPPNIRKIVLQPDGMVSTNEA
jgi:uncharacterized protein (TIGR02594 family)